MFPRDFLWGSATAATHVDGGDRASDWFHWAERGRIADKSSPIIACDHWNRYEDDFKLMKKMGMQVYRMGADWSRFQPEPGAPFDTQALDHFRRMLDSLRKKRIRPLMTLNHFAVPQWWLDRGGWTREENLEAFYAWVDFIVQGVGDLVHEYITFNEPNVYAFFAYVDGRWPPGESGLFGYMNSIKVQRHMVMAHFRLYRRLNEIHARNQWKTPIISIAKHMRVMDPRDAESALDLDRTREADYRFNRVFPDCIHSGQLLDPLGRNEKLHDGPAWDFFGLNYYSRDFVSFNLLRPHTMFIDVETHKSAPRNDLGWEIYPEGLYRLLMDVHERYGLPIRVTENGIADDDDDQREQFLKDHLRNLHRAIEAGAQVDAYYHWSFMDNFEWAEGYVARFGLIEMNYETQERIPRPSSKLYSQIIRTGNIPD